MIRHRFIFPLAVLVIALSQLPTTHAATASLTYGSLASCYQLGSTIPAFTLTASVAIADQYRMSHTVSVQGTPETPIVVYEGPIDPVIPHTATIQGGNAYVAGTYTLTGALYVVSSGILVAHTSETISIAADCTIDPSPAPSAKPTVEPDVAPADIRWWQQASPSQGVPTNGILTITVQGVNVGQRRGGSDALVHYDPVALRLLDATPIRAGDWVRSRDDVAGTVTLALGSLAYHEQGGLRVRFLAIQPMSRTIVRTIRDDGQDLANPLFLSLGAFIDGPYQLTTDRTSTGVKITGRGYKPGERIVIWGNTRSGKVVAVNADTYAGDTTEGMVQLLLSQANEDIVSLVLLGQRSSITGIAQLPSE